jgi:hypothetical protein
VPRRPAHLQLSVNTMADSWLKEARHRSRAPGSLTTTWNLSGLPARARSSTRELVAEQGMAATRDPSVCASVV